MIVQTADDEASGFARRAGSARGVEHFDQHALRHHVVLPAGGTLPRDVAEFLRAVGIFDGDAQRVAATFTQLRRDGFTDGQHRAQAGQPFAGPCKMRGQRVVRRSSAANAARRPPCATASRAPRFRAGECPPPPDAAAGRSGSIAGRGHSSGQVAQAWVDAPLVSFNVRLLSFSSLATNHLRSP